MELNGLFHIQTEIQKMCDEHRVSVADAQCLFQKIELLNRYLTAYGSSPDPSVMWHEVLSNPEKYPTLAEYNTRAFEEAKKHDR